MVYRSEKKLQNFKSNSLQKYRWTWYKIFARLSIREREDWEKERQGEGARMSERESVTKRKTERVRDRQTERERKKDTESKRDF